VVRSGGIYFIDDLPQANWRDGHGPNVAALIDALRAGRTSHGEGGRGQGLMLVVRAGAWRSARL